MKGIIDTNILIYAISESAPEYQRARGFLEKALSGPEIRRFSENSRAEGGGPFMKPMIEAVAAVIEREGKFLITKRLETSPMGHCWEFPGGKIEKGETVEECAVRECREEIDVLIKPVRRLRDVWYDYPHGKVFLHFVLCKIVSGEPRPVECRETRWIDPHQFTDFEFPPADISVIEFLRRPFNP